MVSARIRNLSNSMSNTQPKEFSYNLAARLDRRPVLSASLRHAFLLLLSLVASTPTPSHLAWGLPLASIRVTPFKTSSTYVVVFRILPATLATPWPWLANIDKSKVDMMRALVETHVGSCTSTSFATLSASHASKLASRSFNNSIIAPARVSTLSFSAR